jgi:aminoglycoside phosphotransferase family enzyme
MQDWMCDVRFEEKVAFLSRPDAYDMPAGDVTRIETHTAMVFLVGDRAYKIKKPVTFGIVNFRSLQTREFICHEELRLNRQLAGPVYVGVIPLVVSDKGALRLGGVGHVVDWLVHMRRLPSEQFLDNRLKVGIVSDAEVVALMDRLSAFYQDRRAETVVGGAYFEHLHHESVVNAAHLSEMARHLGPEYSPLIPEAATALLQTFRAEIDERRTAGMIVEGHGDLRPEHVCLTVPPVIFDRLEFAPDLRQIDIYDEVNYLGLECAMMGASWIWPRLLDLLNAAHGNPPSPGLLKAYGVFRALTRARLSIDHLRDNRLRTPGKWPVQARNYLAFARRIL